MTNQEEKNVTADPIALIQGILRETYQQNTEDLRYFAEKVRYFNRAKSAVRDYLTALRDVQSGVMSAAFEDGVDLCCGDTNDVDYLDKLFDQYAQEYKVGELEYGLCIPNRAPPAGVNSMKLLDRAIVRWESRLATLGDDSQLANFDLQNNLQKLQQTTQTFSAILKMLHDTDMAIIRNMRA